VAKPIRTFSANVGDESIGVAGPDQIEYDLDEIFKMFDPVVGYGIQEENIKAGAATDAIIGNRTVNQTLDGGANTGTLTQLLSWIVKHILTIKGNVTNWYDTAVSSISDLWAKFNSSTGHSHDGTANNGAIINHNNLSNKGALTHTQIDAHTHTGIDGTSKISAGNVMFSPTGNIASTDVQGAIAELDSEKSAVGHTHIAGIISVTPVGNISSTDVQSALQELDSEKSPTNHTHTASDVGALVSIDQISNPGGDIDFIGGTGIQIVSDAINKTLTFNATGEVIPGPHTHTSNEILLINYNNEDLTTWGARIHRRMIAGVI
jgi:hypothetical protein